MKEKKKSVLKIILLVLLALVVFIMVALPFVLDRAMDAAETKASLLSAPVEKKTVNRTVSGAGTLTDSDAVKVTVPDGVEITEYLVENGQYVTEGTALARIDKTSALQTVSSVQSTLEYIASQMKNEESSSGSGKITASNSGRVIAVYASAGDSVREVMDRCGCLAVMSLDGQFSVEIENGSGLCAGDAVTVSCSGRSAAGRVDRLVNGRAVIVLADDIFEYGQAVTVSGGSGELLGTGELGINRALRITAYSGTVRSVQAAAGKKLSKGATLFTLENTDSNAGYNVLAAEHREYEELIAELFLLYQDGVVKASCDGCVADIDDSLVPTGYSGAAAELEFLAFRGGDTLQLPSGSMPVDGRAVSPSLYADPDTNPATEMVYGYVISVTGGQMRVIFLESGAVGDIRHPNTAYGAVTVAMPADGAYYWGVPETPASPGQPGEGGDGGEGEVPQDTQEGWQQTSVSAGTVYVFGCNGDRCAPLWMVRAGSSSQDNPSGPNGKPGMGGFGGAFGYTPAVEFEKYEIAPVELMSVVPQDELTVTITVDELDILSVRKGMEATVTLDALPGRSYSGTVTEINTAGENAGGSTKYTATVTLARESNMLAGMNASCLLTVDSFGDVLTIPSEAIACEGGKQIVYTGCDEKNGVLLNPVEVETGVSDGIVVEILSGLSEGDTIWYAYYDTLPISLSFGSFPGPGIQTQDFRREK